MGCGVVPVEEEDEEGETQLNDDDLLLDSSGEFNWEAPGKASLV